MTADLEQAGTTQTRRLDRLQGWPAFVPGLLSSAAIAAGFFENRSAVVYLAAALLGGLLLLTIRPGGKTSAFAPENPAAAEASAILSLTAAAWLLLRLLHPYAPQSIIIPVALVAWIFLTQPWRPVLPGLTAAFGMETALTVTGAQTYPDLLFNIICYATSAGGTLLMIRSRAYRHRLRKELSRERQGAAADEYARDLGLRDPAPPLDNPFHEMEQTVARSTRSPVADLSKTLETQLVMIRQALSLTTLALLWPDQDRQQLRLRSISSSRTDIDDTPFPVGTGITGALLGPETEIAVAPVRAGLARLPYYRHDHGVGAVFAVRLDERPPLKDGKTVAPILCADRVGTAPWSAAERDVLLLTAAKLLQDVRMERRFQRMDQERGAVRKICMGLHELNGALDLEQVLRAIGHAIANLVTVDLLAVVLTEGDDCRVVLAEGRKAESLRGRIFTGRSGLVGQVLRMRRPLPARAEAFGPVKLFDDAPPLEGFKSLLVLPLAKGAEILGALVVAAARKDLFTASLQEILLMIGAQVAVKIDLGKAHEQISRLATTDGLTGLANHRTFQHGFGMIIERARRRQTPVCLLLCDLDHFKKINDTFGHPFGDRVLQGVAGVLSRAVRTVDLAARYGGEEFAIILEDSDKKGGKKLAERIRNSIGELHFTVDDREVPVTMSVGLAAWPEDADEKAELLSLADQALYQAKKAGRNRTVAWSSVSPASLSAPDAGDQRRPDYQTQHQNIGP